MVGTLEHSIELELEKEEKEDEKDENKLVELNENGKKVQDSSGKLLILSLISYNELIYYYYYYY